MNDRRSPLDLGSMPSFSVTGIEDGKPPKGDGVSDSSPATNEARKTLRDRFRTGFPEIWNSKGNKALKLGSPSGALTHIRALKARQDFEVQGEGVIVAVIDSGCNEDTGLQGRVLPGRAFLDAGDGADTKDSYGHGTSVAGLIAGSANLGVAPKAQILPVKVIKDGSDSTNIMTRIAAALEWLAEQDNIWVVNLSLGNNDNYSTATSLPEELRAADARISSAISVLRQKRTPVVAATGNSYAVFRSSVGMCYPAILPSVISVGAVHSGESVTNTTYPFGNAETFQSHFDDMAPFSQRLPLATSPAFTRLIAPGAPVLVIRAGGTVAPGSGTSLAAPLVTGVIALMQELHIRKHGTRPECRDIENWLMAGAKIVVDKPGSHVNVTNTGASFSRLDAVGALNLVAGADGTS